MGTARRAGRAYRDAGHPGHWVVFPWRAGVRHKAVRLAAPSPILPAILVSPVAADRHISGYQLGAFPWFAGPLP